MKREITTQKEEQKLPLFVTVYETMYGWLQAGRFQPGEKLPGENVLAEQLNVSRGTLRQAMLLLQEDGLIINHQGKGSFVLSNARLVESGAERLNNPMLEYCNQPITHVHVDISFQVATEKHRSRLNLPVSALVAVIELHYQAGERIVGMAMSFMAHELLAKHEVPVDDNDAVYRFYNEFLETPGLSASTQVRIAYARQATAEIMGIQEKDPLLMMEEIVFADSEPTLIQKLFFLPDYYVIPLRRKNDRYTK